VCDGLTRDLQDVKYLLSPQDLAGYASIPELIRAGVASLKIEGRLKTPEYVANITSQYRRAIGAALEHRECPITRDDHREMELSFSRGLAPGWLEGNDHKRLVPGRHSAKLGIVLGTILRVRGQEIQLQLAAPLALGDGIALHVVGQETPQGSRVYSIHNQQGSVKHASEGDTVWVECRHGDLDQVHLQPKTEVYKNDDPQLNRRLRQTFTDVDPRERQPVDMTVTAMAGDPLVLTAKLASGQTATFTSNDPLPVAIKHPANRETLAEKLGRLGGTPFRLGTLDCHLHRDPIVPVALLNEARRAVVTQLLQSIQTPPRRTVDVASGRRLLKPIRSNRDTHSETTNTSPVQLVVLCRTLDQLRAAVEQGVPLCYADFHDVRQYREARQLAKGSNTHLGLSSVRIQKPGEMGLLRYLTKAEPDCVLARNLAAIDYFVQRNVPVVADFSLNVANHRSAEWIRSLGVDRVTVSYDLNRDQLFDLLKAVPGDWMEIVLHQHMPMFHMEHCVFCSVLSPGTNKTNCGRPCDRHVVQLRDRVGAEHTLQADVACRNTLYNSTPQSGAEWLSEIHAVGVQYFRIELLDESPSDTLSTIQGYRDLLDGRVAPAELLRRLAAINRVGVTRGTLETKRDPLAII
jgi:putative protease